MSQCNNELNLGDMVIYCQGDSGHRGPCVPPDLSWQTLERLVNNSRRSKAAARKPRLSSPKPRRGTK